MQRRPADAPHRAVQGLVAVRLGRGDVILAAPLHALPQAAGRLAHDVAGLGRKLLSLVLQKERASEDGLPCCAASEGASLARCRMHIPACACPTASTGCITCILVLCSPHSLVTQPHPTTAHRRQVVARQHDGSQAHQIVQLHSRHSRVSRQLGVSGVVELQACDSWPARPSIRNACTCKVWRHTCARARPPAAVFPSRSSFLRVENSVLVRPCTCSNRFRPVEMTGNARLAALQRRPPMAAATSALLASQNKRRASFLPPHLEAARQLAEARVRLHCRRQPLLAAGQQVGIGHSLLPQPGRRPLVRLGEQNLHGRVWSKCAV